LAQQLISADDMDIIQVIDDPETIVDAVRKIVVV
jgi:predicted Rossmann-fold nucleotide-binding protein